MSAEAVRAVMDQSPANGTHLLVLVAIALASKDRGNSPESSIGFDAIASHARICKRRAKAIVAELIEKGQLKLVYWGGGNQPNRYALPVLKPCPLPVLDLAPLVREEPLEHTARADLQCTGTTLRQGEKERIIRFPVVYQAKGSKSKKGASK